MIEINRFGFQYDGFCNLLSLAFSKAGYKMVSKEEISSWIGGILFAFDLMDCVGPYVSAFQDYESNKANLEKFPFYRKYYRGEGLEYLHWYKLAVAKAVEYMIEIWNLYTGQIFTRKRQNDYEAIIIAEDMTSPLAFSPN